MEKGHPVYHSDGNCLIKTADKLLVQGSANSVIPDDGSVTAIGDGAFYKLTTLTVVVLPECIEVIEDYAFYYCSALTEMVIPDSVKSIGAAAFNHCTGLTSVIIGNGVTDIGDNAFYYCRKLTNVTVGSGVVKVDLQAFMSCSKLSLVHYVGTETEWENITFGNSNEYFTDAERHYLTAETDEASCTEDAYTVYTCGSCDYSHSVKISGKGHSYVNGVCTVCGAYPESGHSYTESTDEVWEICHSGAVSVTITFSAETFVDENDYICIYDAADNEIGKYTGSELASQTVTVAGNTAKIRLVTGGSNSSYGFAVTDIAAGYRAGDLNADGATDILDFIRLKKIISNTSQSNGDSPDIDGSGDTDTDDMVIFKKFLLGVIAELRANAI